MSSQNLRETCKNTMKEKQKDSRLKLVNKLRNVPEETQTKSSPKNQTSWATCNISYGFIIFFNF